MPDRARRAFREAYKVANDSALTDYQWMASASLGFLEKSLGEFDAACEALESAVSIIELQRELLVAEEHKHRFFIDREDVYAALVSVLLSQGRRSLAFLAVERSRSRALLDLMRTASFQEAAGVPQDLLQEEASLMERELVAARAIAAGNDVAARGALQRQVRKARQALDVLLDKILSIAPEYAALRRGEPTPFEDAIRLTDDIRRIVLAEFHVAEREIRIFGIIPGAKEPEVATVPIDVAELRRFARQNFGAHGKIREFVADGLEPLWHAYDGLVEPLAKWTERGDVVYLMPHGLLHYLPMHALRVSSGEYLIERNPVVYAPSASVLKFCRAKRKPKPISACHAAVFGDSRLDLQMARLEARQVADMFGVTPVTGDKVDRKSILNAMSTADLLHFAGHGYFDAADPLASGLLLSHGASMTAREMLNMSTDFRPRLVALSGCETGISEQAPGDELLGLTRAFLFAGAPSLLMSLWRVNDESTAFLMREFYRRLCDERFMLSMADALQQATLETKTRYPSMDRWAPFTLIGDWY